MRADGDGREVDDTNLFANTGVVWHIEFPREVDVHSWFPINPLSNFGAKRIKKPLIESWRPIGGGEKKNAFQKMSNRKKRAWAVQSKVHPIIEQIVPN
jgi:hypothetical protein